MALKEVAQQPNRVISVSSAIDDDDLLREQAFLNFIESISTEATRETYTYALKRFMVF